MHYRFAFDTYDPNEALRGPAKSGGESRKARRAGQPTRSFMQKAKERARTMLTIDKAKVVAGWLRDKKAIDVRAIDVRGLSPITEAFVVATATSVRHAQGLANHLLDRIAEEKLEYLGMEGFPQGAWILVDLNDVLVHIFQADNRGFYNIEGLWSEGKPIELPLHEAD